MGHSRAAPATGDGEKDFGEFLDEGLLLFESEFEIAVALLAWASVAKMWPFTRKSGLPMCEDSSASQGES